MAMLQPLQDRRAQLRRTASIQALALPGDVECTISDISDDGARVACPDTDELADFPIVVEWDSGRAHDCVVVWRQGTQAGLRFLRTCLLTGVVPAPFRGAQTAWLAARSPPRP